MEAEGETCVAEDKDGDGLLNKLDRCPDQPEDKNGFEDDDGCPDEPRRAAIVLRRQAEQKAVLDAAAEERAEALRLQQQVEREQAEAVARANAEVERQRRKLQAAAEEQAAQEQEEQQAAAEKLAEKQRLWEKSTGAAGAVGSVSAMLGEGYSQMLRAMGWWDGSNFVGMGMGYVNISDGFSNRRDIFATDFSVLHGMSFPVLVSERGVARLAIHVPSFSTGIWLTSKGSRDGFVAVPLACELGGFRLELGPSDPKSNRFYIAARAPTLGVLLLDLEKSYRTAHGTVGVAFELGVTGSNFK